MTGGGLSLAWLVHSEANKSTAALDTKLDNNTAALDIKLYNYTAATNAKLDTLNSSLQQVLGEVYYLKGR